MRKFCESLLNQPGCLHIFMSHQQFVRFAAFLAAWPCCDGKPLWGKLRAVRTGRKRASPPAVLPKTESASLAIFLLCGLSGNGFERFYFSWIFSMLSNSSEQVFFLSFQRVPTSFPRLSQDPHLLVKNALIRPLQVSADRTVRSWFAQIPNKAADPKMKHRWNETDETGIWEVGVYIF